MPKPNAVVSALPSTIPFVAPERMERESGRPFAARLGANESSFGPSPRAIEAMQRTARQDVWKYCDPEAFDLTAALARHLGIRPAEIVVGAGIDNLLGLTVRIFSEPGDAIVTSLGAYPTFNYHVNGYGRRLVTVPYRNDRADLDALAETVRRENASIVYLANPDNPMGTWHDAEAIESFAASLPGETLLLLDEAYGEMAPPSALPPLDTGRNNIVRARTFSKAYGLAGLRVGYLVGAEPICAQYHKVRDHFGVNIMAQSAALAALSDCEWLASVLAKVASARERIASIAKESGLAALPSAANFVTIDCGQDGDFAMGVLKALDARSVFIRKPMAPGLDRCIRVSCGLQQELDLFETALPEALAAAGRSRR
ncbi:pyridoxal phosphate-dependent aminotransferase [Oricola cellulosilytica]|uniref:Pyridoxal phosphate-dependent aminotransferase n=1 Tax=Oricola cellulosilytica TaxID=1429082 RepID=A0A4R0PFB2_9HYPH|nr:pyridoxal phosphate-dependent aminotransferase [Oricola cellulosilytica]TCD14174.1 pyridoxal phosphate-dependent aminotransferase [Oricola cellulosilytica]